MKLEIFSVLDSKAELFIQPFFSPTIATGIRLFEGAVNNPQDATFAQHADDYTLFNIGSFNQETGILTPPENNFPINLGLASGLLKKDE